MLDNLPGLTSHLPGVGGVLKSAPEDFAVEEIPAYPTSGEGEHLFLWIEKTDVAAEVFLSRIADTLGISPADVGIAGMKDRRGVTRQFVSVPAHCEPQIPGIDGEGIRVLSASRHTNKLRTGHLRGNRFEILLRDPTFDEEAFRRAEAIRQLIETHGFPNYYGLQRFGNAGQTLATGLDLLTGRTKPHQLPRSRRRFLLRLGLSAVQSFLFNRVVAERLVRGLSHTVLPGDVMQVVASGGLFVVDEADEQVDAEQRRCNAGQTAVTGPLFGPKMKQPTGEPARIEEAILADAGLDREVFTTHKKLTSGGRRAMLVRPGELTIHREPGGLRFCFTLPPGSYATVLLREFQRGSVPHAPSTTSAPPGF